MERVKRLHGHLAEGGEAATAAGVHREPTAAAVKPKKAAAAKKKKKKKKAESPILDAALDDGTWTDPPVVELPDGVLFPTYPDIKRDHERLGRPSLFTYGLMGGRRMTFVVDSTLSKVIFFPDHTHITTNQEALAHHWFGIDREMSRQYTPSSLVAVRKALKQGKARGMNDIVGQGILQQFDDFGAAGEADLFDFAWLTFWPVNAAMYGEQTVSPQVCPHIRGELETFNSKFELVVNGMPREMFPDMEDAAVSISRHFGDKIAEGLAEKEACPILKARDASIEDKTPFSLEQRGRFQLSVFWAAQANTIPGTFWALALVLSHPEVKAKCTEEAMDSGFVGVDGSFDVKKLPYTNAVIKEVLRLKVANITHRKATKPFGLKGADGVTYRVPKGDSLTVSSYVHHHDETVFADPEAFRPERWLDGTKYPPNTWMPFGSGPNTCSGKWLALNEIATTLALTLQTFDAELIGPVPQENWVNVVAMVTPQESVKIKYTRR